MKLIPVIIVLLFLLIMAMGAGCTQAASPATDPAGPATPLSGVALTAAEAPVNFTLVESRAKTSDEVGDLARSLGWQGGYTVRYSGLPDTPMGATEIVQTITTYPKNQMAEIVAFIDSNDRSSQDLAITILPSPGLGEYSRAFAGRSGSMVVLEENANNPLDSGSQNGAAGYEIVEIIFSKGPNLVVLKMTGPGADYATLSSLAAKAYAKIP